jgi:flagellar basal-body rod modification protein FlgD
MEVNGIPIIENKTGETNSSATLAENFDNFLTLLTTQLQHQDPLSPLDTAEFTNQLTNFAQVEQIINSNKKLDSLINLQGAVQLSTGVSYIGKIAEAPGDVMLLDDSQGQIGYQLSESSAQTNITILDQQNNLVGIFQGNTNAGPHVFNWDGLDGSGNQRADGAYRILVTALDNEGNTIETSTTTFGKVTGVEVEGGNVTLTLGPLSVDLEDVVSVHEPQEASGTDEEA